MSPNELGLWLRVWTNPTLADFHIETLAFPIVEKVLCSRVLFRIAEPAADPLQGIVSLQDDPDPKPLPIYTLAKVLFGIEQYPRVDGY